MAQSENETCSFYVYMLPFFFLLNFRVHETSEIVHETVKALEQLYYVTDKILLVKSLIVVVIMFFLSNAIPNITVGLGTYLCMQGFVALYSSDEANCCIVSEPY